MTGKLILKDNTIIEGQSFGAIKSVSGEVVFATGMTGYPEALTDPSFRGQILVLTYPLIGNYGIPEKKYWESGRMQIAGLIVSNYINTPSHFEVQETLGYSLKKEQIPALEIRDTRFLTQKLRAQGVILGKIILGNDCLFHDPNQDNLASEVSLKKPRIMGRGNKRVILIDCGTKRNIERELVGRGFQVMVVPWNFDPFQTKLRFHGLVISNGPGDPKMLQETISVVKKAVAKRLPIFGICLGNQLLALAAGGDTKKLKFGHRGQNHPVRLWGSEKLYLTTQNHGFVVSKIPAGFKGWFVNANDGTNEGIIHKSLPFMSVQFHPEAAPGPMDTSWLFDKFAGIVKGTRV